VMAQKNGEIPGKPVTDFPTVYDGERGMQFVETVVEASKDKNTKWYKWVE